MADNLNQFSQWAGDKTKAEAAPPINNGQANLGHPAGAAAPGNGHFTVSPDNPFFQGTEAIPQPAAQPTDSPVHRPPPRPTTGNPFLDPHRPDADPQSANLNPFLTPGKPYAQPTADGQAVPQIFGRTDQPAAPQSNNPFLNPFINGQYEAALAQQTNPFVNGAGFSPEQPAPAPPHSNNPFVNGAGAAAGLPPAPTAADTAKAGVEQQTRLGVFCLGMHDFVLALCEQQGLPPSAVKGLLDFYLDASVTAIQASQTIMASAGLSGSAPPVDTQAIKVAALARQADSAKQAELIRLQQMKKSQPRPDDPSTFDPLTRRNAGRHRPITRLSSLVKPGTSTASPSSSDADSSGSTSTPRATSSNTSQVKIPPSSSTSISDSDGGSDDAGESSSVDDSSAGGDGISLSQTLGNTTPRGAKQPPVAKQPTVAASPPLKATPVKPQRPQTGAKQDRDRQDDPIKANLAKQVQLRGQLMTEHALAIADLEEKLEQATASQGRMALLLHRKDQQYKLHRQATEEWSRLYEKKKAGTATPAELAHMDELDIRSTAALEQVNAIKAVAAHHGIAL